MNFLQLVQTTFRECGCSGTAPATTAGQTGESSRLVGWVAEAWQDIQRDEPYWDWMRGTVSFNTVAGDQTYSATDAGISDFAEWIPKNFRVYLASAGYGNEAPLSFIPWDYFRDTWLFSTMRTVQSRPIVISQNPGKTLYLAPLPNDVYTVVGEYYKTPSVLSSDSDTPEIPSRWHMAIVHKARKYYGVYENAPEVVFDAEQRYSEIMSHLRGSQLQPIMLGGPLA